MMIRIALVVVGLMWLGLMANVTLANVPKSFYQVAQQKVSVLHPNIAIDSIDVTPIKQMYAVKLSSGPLIYMHESGEYFFSGSLFKIEKNGYIDLTEMAGNGSRATQLAAIGRNDMIVFSPTLPLKTRGHVYIFTDVDCYYCQKMHEEVPALNAQGIEVRYLAFPRAGVGSGTYKKMVSAWCAKEPTVALTRLKNKQSIEPSSCKNPVSDQYNVGKSLGVSGTPAIVLADGTMIPGYQKANQLIKSMGL